MSIPISSISPAAEAMSRIARTDDEGQCARASGGGYFVERVEVQAVPERMSEGEGAVIEIKPRQRGSGFAGSMFNNVNSLTGIGILSTPYATAQAGWLSLSILLFFSVICCYTAELLRRCMDHGRLKATRQRPAAKGRSHGLQEPLLGVSADPINGHAMLPANTCPPSVSPIPDAEQGQQGSAAPAPAASPPSLRPPRSYPDIGEAACGAAGRWATALLLYLEVFCVGVELLILEGDNLAHLFPMPPAVAAALPLSLSPKAAYSLLAAALVLPTVWLRDLSLLAYVSAGGVAASVLVVAGVAWVGAADGVGFHAASSPGQLFHAAGLPAAIGLFAFCLAGHAVFPNMYLAMADKRQYTSVVVSSFSISTALYVGIAALGFSMFGDAVQTQVTLNLPPAVPAATVAIWTTVVTPFTKFALTLMPLALALEEVAGCGPAEGPSASASASASSVLLRSIAVRSALVGAALFVALAVPFFGYVMAFIGSFLSLTTAVVLPCLFYVRIRKGHLGRAELLLNYALIAVGLVAAAVGTWYSVAGIVGGWRSGV